jgi:hypothetical protein
MKRIGTDTLSTLRIPQELPRRDIFKLYDSFVKSFSVENKTWLHFLLKLFLLKNNTCYNNNLNTPLKLDLG